MRFTVNLHGVRNDDDTINNMFPLNTFVTDDPCVLLRELGKLFSNDMSGINKIVILDESMGKLSEAWVGQNRREL
jgi:hypothetical protein